MHKKREGKDGPTKGHHEQNALSKHHKEKSQSEISKKEEEAPPVIVKPLTSDMLKKLDQIEEEAEVMPTPGREEVP
jgi:hypothetical protein